MGSYHSRFACSEERTFNSSGFIAGGGGGDRRDVKLSQFMHPRYPTEGQRSRYRNSQQNRIMGKNLTSEWQKHPDRLGLLAALRVTLHNYAGEGRGGGP